MYVIVTDPDPVEPVYLDLFDEVRVSAKGVSRVRGSARSGVLAGTTEIALS
jgi:hypothetical protein